jgi:flagellar FliJ protein
MAKKFNFRLNSVLKMRAEKVAQAQDLLNQAVKVRMEKEKAIQNYNDYKNSLLEKKFLSSKITELQTQIHHKEYIDSEIVKLEKEKQQILEIENLRRLKLTKALKDEKIIEKLKDKKFQDHKDELLREESKFFDEVGLRTKLQNINNT